MVEQTNCVIAVEYKTEIVCCIGEAINTENGATD
jgi:hypothetical protein